MVRSAVGRVGHHLEHAVAEHHVGRGSRNVVGEVGEVALDAGDQVGDVGLVGAPVEGRERVRTRVDDGDGVSLPGQPDREPAGAAADVDDPGVRLEPGRDGVPDHAGADRAAALAGRHAAQPRGLGVAGHPGLPGLRCHSLRATSLTDSPAGLTSAYGDIWKPLECTSTRLRTGVGLSPVLSGASCSTPTPA